MQGHGPFFILAIIVISTAAWLFRAWIRARYEEGSERPLRSAGELDADRKVALLEGENERLQGQVGRLEERIAVLERIATDPATRTAREIDALR